jgi:hypothetical protein
MDGRRFRIEPWMASPKIASASAFLERSGSIEVLSLVTFFAPAKKVTRRQAKALLLMA